jgi:hypothetical protein
MIFQEIISYCDLYTKMLSIQQMTIEPILYHSPTKLKTTHSNYKCKDFLLLLQQQTNIIGDYWQDNVLLKDNSRKEFLGTRK